MDVCFTISDIAFWQFGKSSAESPTSALPALDAKGWPKLEWVPPMQRRRLSPFMKMALHCAHEVTNNLDTPLQSVFASRHGDLTKTSRLLTDLARKEALSPTEFSLSVHNAVSGLFSILSKNEQPSTTIAAGENTFIMGLIEASVRSAAHNEPVLFVLVDQAMPVPFDTFASESQESYAIAMVINTHPTDNSTYRLTRKTAGAKTSPQAPFALQFMAQHSAHHQCITLSSESNAWLLEVVQ